MRAGWITLLLLASGCGFVTIGINSFESTGLQFWAQQVVALGFCLSGVVLVVASILHRALRARHDEYQSELQSRTDALETEVIERRRAEVALKQQFTHISLLNSITRAMATRQDLGCMVGALIRQLREHLPIEFGWVYLYDAQSQQLTPALTGTTSAEECGPELVPPHSTIDTAGMRACLQGDQLNMPDTGQLMELLPLALARQQLGSAVATPLMVMNSLFGVLVVARRPAQGFEESDRDFLRVLSEQVAVAIHQSRLHSQLQLAYDELRNTQQAVMTQERLSALGQMASGIAHDINNALCPVVVYSDLLLKTSSSLEETGRKQLQHIKVAGEDIAHIVSRMREFYRPRDAGDLLEPVDLNKLLEQVSELTRPRWRDIPQGKGITIELRLELHERLPEIRGNPSELREAITNLVLNALDAMPSGGVLGLRTQVHGWSRGDSGHAIPNKVLLEVSDSGTGMDEETRKRCLEPFFSTKGQRGTGLGLAMVYGVMQRHDGNIDIISEPGRGTQMRLVFPAAMPSAAATPFVPGTPRLPRMRILCIDDEPLLREMMKQLLEEAGHEPEVADSGDAGMELFRAGLQQQRPFNVVITDLGMPHLDGRQVAALVKREAPSVPVIMLTGWGNIMKDAGDVPPDVDGILCKPPKLAELFEMIARLTGLTPHLSTRQAKAA